MWRVQGLLLVATLLLIACGGSIATTTIAADDDDGASAPTTRSAGTTTTAADVADGPSAAAPTDRSDDAPSFGQIMAATAEVIRTNGMEIADGSEMVCAGVTGQDVTCTGETNGGQTIESAVADLSADNPTLVVRIDGEVYYDGPLAPMLPEYEPWFGQAPPVGVIPDLSLQDHLYHPATGTSNFDEQSGVFETNGDWYLVGSWMESFIPVPAGWTTLEPGSETYIMFSEELDLVVTFDAMQGQPEGYVVLGVDGFEGDDRTAQEALDSVVTALSDGGSEIVAGEVVDEGRAYLVAEQDSTRILLVLSRNPVKGWYHTLVSVFDDAAQWDEYYPIVRAMVGGWYGLYENPLGFPLPADLD